MVIDTDGRPSCRWCWLNKVCADQISRLAISIEWAVVQCWSALIISYLINAQYWLINAQYWLVLIDQWSLILAVNLHADSADSIKFALTNNRDWRSLLNEVLFSADQHWSVILSQCWSALNDFHSMEIDDLDCWSACDQHWAFNADQQAFNADQRLTKSFFGDQRSC